MTPPDLIHDLIDRFRANLDSYKRGQYKETGVRREFIDPLFDALGWDVTNKQGYAEAYKEVVHEDAIRVGDKAKAPDYSFRIGGVRKFFVEAKKPSVDVKGDPHPAYQLRRYAWSAKLPLSILTDFEEFAVYDCRTRPDKNDKPATARVLYVTFDQYAARWEEIAGVFSREAILKGAFDRYAEARTGKRGTAEVDAAFLAEIEGWRDRLARVIALRNPGLGQRELNFAVQQTIDRIIFLRICEDRGIEPYNTLHGLTNGGDIYPRLLEHFRHADARYNSGLFCFENEPGRGDAVDRITPRLQIDDKVLREILRGLYYPDSPYEFSVLPADLLGQVYEQFLGKVIRLVAHGQGQRAVVEEKPEVRKAGGVFYTPTFIVDAIVKQTVGKLLAGSTLRQVAGLAPRLGRKAAPLRIADIACGSGSFLLGAYQFLLDWHLAAYVAEGAQKWATGRSPRLYQTGRGDWKLTVAERKRILLDHIYGVDIDPQAVEVTKLSLLLKVLEGEDEQSIGQQLALFPERALPDLGRNIKCGNSLIGPDFYEGQQMALLDDEAALRINVFDWQAEFPQVFADGGFDGIVGNPPYVRQEGLGDYKSYFEKHYRTFRSTADLYVNFMEQGHRLLRDGGSFGMIVSNKWLRAAYGEPLRRFLAEEVSVREILDFAGLPVFSGATVRTIILISNNEPSQGEPVRYLAPVSLTEYGAIKSADRLLDVLEQRAVVLPSSNLSPNGWSFSGDEISQLLKKMQFHAVTLKDYIPEHKTFFGIKTGLNEAFVVDRVTRDKLVSEDPRSAEIIRPVLAGREVHRYSFDFNDKYLIWTYIGVPIQDYPAIFNHLKTFQTKLEKRWDKGTVWWELRACDYYLRFSEPKIIYPDIATTCRFTLDREGYFSTNTTYFIPGNDLYLLGILNSRLAFRYFSQVCAGLEGGDMVYLRFFGQYLNNFPIRTINFADPADVARHERMVGLVQRMLDLHQKLAAEQTPHVKTVLQRQIEATDKQIDALVYELYGLTAAEIAVVEGG